jgi:TolB protein
VIEEARQRGRRRRRRNAAIVTLIALVGVALFALLGGGAQSQTASPALSARSSVAVGAASSKIAFISEGPPGSGGYCGTVYVMNADGSAQRKLVDSTETCGQEWGHAWSPDGRRIAIVSTGGSPTGAPPFGESEIYLMNADGSGLRELTRDDVRENSPSWSPDGRRIAFLGSGIRVVNADGSGLHRLTRKGWGNFTPAWSPDGQKIAFVRRGDGNLEIYVMNADGSGQRRLTRNTVRDTDPVWSPDGRRIAFVSNWQLWAMNVDGSGLRRLTLNGARNVAPAWSPDGQRIAFERRVGRVTLGSCSGCGEAENFQVWAMNADGSEARKLAQDAAQPVWSPDGQKIAFQYPRGPRGPGGLTKQSDIYVMNADGSGKHNLTRTPRVESQPVWSPAEK